MAIEDLVTPNLYQKRLCIKTKEKSFILDSFKVIIQDKVYWVRAKEVNGWTPIFREEKKDFYSPDEESVQGHLKDKNGVYENGNPVVNDSDVEEDLLNKKKDEGIQNSEDDLQCPPGFTPVNNGVTSTHNNLCEGEVVHESPSTVLEDRLKNCSHEGDFNKVRTEEERFGSLFNRQGANAFNNFIASAGLVDLPLGDMYIDFGAIPFRIFHSWFQRDGIDKMVEGTWKNLDVTDNNRLIRLKKKLQLLKQENRSRIKKEKSSNSMAKAHTQNKLTNIDRMLDQECVNMEVLNQRTELMKSLNDINSLETMEAAQKAKVRWIIEGDGNTKYYHGILNNKRSQLSEELEREVTYHEVNAAV
uniref:RNA-directed DNA polymerase, eukaryota n=1 Tax=Tanacetum cinerariifolium TaxID=118510 RepID=A0A699HY11_TANCI|nr:hypothetical protein [Tanacetum cinerariifolium]